MKKIFLLLCACLSVVPLLATDGETAFRQARWIGAITRHDAHLPEGRSFSGGKLQGEDQALWEAVDTLSRRSIVVGKTIQTSRQVSKAEAIVCGLGFYELSINGQQVGQSVMSPSWSDYDKTVYYNTYDVTPLLRQGKNRVEVLLGNGFYNEQGGRYAKLRISFGPPTVRMALVLTYANGTVETFLTDDSWQWCESPVTFNSLYGGEDYDARLEGKTTWHRVVVQEGPRGQLLPQVAEPVRIMERFSPVSQPRQLAPGVRLYDMGQNLAGFPEITVRGKAGQTVRLTVGETLADDGHVNQRQTGRPHYYLYTLKGDGRETWHPRFSYYGFRYIEVETDAELLDIQSCFIYNAARKTGDFACSNQRFNDTYRIIDRAIRSNWQSVWTDCPHREKLGWLEQDWLNGEGLVCNYDCRTMLEQTMQTIVDAQHADGSMPEIAPEYTVFKGSWAKPFLESPEWGGAIVALPWLYYIHYGDDRLIRRHYDAMKRYVDYLHTQDSCYILRQGLGDWYDYGEGRAGFARNTPVALVSTAHYFRWTDLMSFFATITQHPDDAATFARRSQAIVRAFNKEFYHPDTHQYATGSQAANAIALDLCLVESVDDRSLVLQNILDDIHAHGDRLTTGDVGTRYLFNVLVENGQYQLLYDMLNHDGLPGYGYQIKQGHTTLTEQWNPDHGASMNHFMMAHINNHLLPVFVGLKANAGGITFRPALIEDLQWARGYTEVEGQRVEASWYIEDHQLHADLSLPDGMDAFVLLPFSNQVQQVEGGQHHFTVPLSQKTPSPRP